MQAYFKGRPIFGERGPAGPDGNPIGTIISFMGTQAPDDYLVCDGQTYDISQYPNLAQFFQAQFGTVNHFGGDGENTFAVPDLRNLFLRGYHGVAEEKLSGEIGEKQDATIFPNIHVNASDGAVHRSTLGDQGRIRNMDTYKQSDRHSYGDVSHIEMNSTSIADITSRPVNTAVLYCIKATSTPSGVEEYDTDDGWHVRKWSNGRLEMSISKDVTVNITTAWASPVHASNVVYLGKYPTTFAKRYCEFINAEMGEAGWYTSVRSTRDKTKDAPAIIFYRSGSTPNVSVTIDYIFIGRWK